MTNDLRLPDEPLTQPTVQGRMRFIGSFLFLVFCSLIGFLVFFAFVIIVVLVAQ